MKLTYREEETKIEIIETFIQGKISEDLCEDASYISNDFIAVIDGVTSKSDFLHKGKTTGKIAAEILVSTLKDIKRNTSVKELIEATNQKIKEFYETVEFPYSKEEKGVQAVCAIYSDYYREIWLIGDCEVSIDGKIYSNSKPSDDILADMRSLILNIIKVETPMVFSTVETQQMARDVIEPWILKSTVFANDETTNYGYSVVNGKEIPQSLIKTIKLDDNAHEIILASDGYPKVKGNLQQTEAYLMKVMEIDKECCNLYKSTKGLSSGYKSYDDRTYIRFLVDKVSPR